MSTARRVKVDGRRARGDRARAVVVDASLDLIQRGDLRPSAERIAARAGVSPRLVFHHFADLESLYGAAAERQFERLQPLLKRCSAEGPFENRLKAFLRQRSLVWETITPVRRAALLREPYSRELTLRLATARDFALQEAARIFAQEISKFPRAKRVMVIASLGAVSSWQMWEGLRRHQGLTEGNARRVLKRTIAAVLSARY
jgi:TetR/AcrR family transcriptional regulator, regulator of autoinduction and epiphytic fitness